jgi:branched-chain amino acid transport system substrate-binding protein
MNRAKLGAGLMVVALAAMACTGGSGGSAAPSSAASAGASAGASASSAAGPAEDFLLGSLAPLTGVDANAGAQWHNGVEMAVNEINEAGGIECMGGANIRVLEGDHQGKPEVGGAETERLIEEGAHAMIGAISSGVTLVSTQVSEREGIPYLVPLSVSDEIMTRGFKTVFRTMEGADLATQVSAEHLKVISDTVTPIKTVGILHEDSVFATAVADGLATHLPEQGFEIVGRVPFKADVTDITPELTELKAAQPDILAVTTSYNGAQLILRTMRQLDFNVKGIFGTRSGAFTDNQFLSELGSTSEYAFSSDNSLDLKDPAALAVYQKYEETYDRPPSVLSIDPYVAVKYVLKDALDRACSYDKDAIIEALRSTNIADHIKPGGPITFDENGQNPNAEPLTVQVQEGKLVTVWPPDYATGEIVLPAPTWAEREPAP